MNRHQLSLLTSRLRLLSIEMDEIVNDPQFDREKVRHIQRIAELRDKAEEAWQELQSVTQAQTLVE